MKREEIRAMIREELQTLLTATKERKTGVRSAVEELNTQWKERRTHTTKDIK
jgi:hypothetical protein